MDPSQILLALRGATLGYGRHVVLRNVDIVVPTGQMSCIIGPNGSGKTTILRALLGLLRPAAGRLDFPNGKPRIGYIQQRQFVDDLFPLTVGEIVLMGRLGRVGAGRRYKPRDRAAAAEAIHTAGIEDLAGRLYRNLSGGQKQRCLLARALASEPDLLVLDEPTNDMDIAGEERTLRLVDRIRREQGITIVMVTHLLNLVVHYAGQITLLSPDRLVTGPASEIASSEQMTEFFGTPIAVQEFQGRRIIVPLLLDEPPSPSDRGGSDD